jgi:Uncharacterized conserved protein
MMTLPRLMVAPNGARRSKADHPALPVTLPEITDTAQACQRAGADGLHLHLRDANCRHVLDIGLYREAMLELRKVVPEMAIQITTEAAGLYSAPHQRLVALGAGADLVSAAVREMALNTPKREVSAFYTQCAARGIAVQHILYDAAEFDLLASLLPKALFTDPALQLIFDLAATAGIRKAIPPPCPVSASDVRTGTCT